MAISDCKAIFGLTATGTADRPLSSGTIQLGRGMHSLNLPTGNLAVVGSLYLQASGDIGSLDGTSNFAATNTTNLAEKATGYITYGSPQNGDEIAVDGTVFTKVSGASSISGSYASAIGLQNLINLLNSVNATISGSVITITAAVAGEAGNAITIIPGASNTGTVTISGSKLTGGQDATAWSGMGQDFQGGDLAIPSEALGIYVYVESGSVILTGGTTLKVPIPASGEFQLAAPGGISALLQSLVFTATAADTRLFISIICA